MGTPCTSAELQPGATGEPYEDCSEGERRSGDYPGLLKFRKTYGNVRQRRKEGRALTKWKRNGARAQTLTPSFLKKTRRPQPRDWIRNRLPFEYPTGHRKAQSCVTQMHEPHVYPQRSESAITSGEDQHHYRQHSSGILAGQGPTVPLRWPGSNTGMARKWVTQG